MFFVCLFVFVFVVALFVFVMCIVSHMLPVSLNCPFMIAPPVFSNVFLIAPSVFSNVYLLLLLNNVHA